MSALLTCLLTDGKAFLVSSHLARVLSPTLKYGTWNNTVAWAILYSVPGWKETREPPDTPKDKMAQERLRGGDHLSTRPPALLSIYMKVDHSIYLKLFVAQET